MMLTATTGLRLARTRAPFMTYFCIQGSIMTNNYRTIRNPVSPLANTGIRFIVSRAAKEVAKRPTLAAKAAGKLPKFMTKYGQSLIGAPVSHIIAFLAVHELTAIVPLFGLWYAFNYFDYMPQNIPDWVFGAGEDFMRKLGERNDWEWLKHADEGSKVLLHGVAAYAVVKATLPLRIVFSLWAMPFVARNVVVPFNRFLGRITGLGKKKKASEGDLPDNLKQKKPEDPKQ